LKPFLLIKEALKMNNTLALKKSELRLKQAQEIAHLGSWELDFSTRVAVWSDEACKIYGLPTEDNLQSYEVWMSFIHPEDMERVKKEIKRSQADLSDSSMEHRILLKDGTIKHLHSISKFEFDDTGNPCGLFGVCRDITEKMRVKEQIEFDQNNLYSLINNTNDLMWSVDRNYNLITSNKPFNEMAKTTFGKVIDKGENILSVSFTPEMFDHFKGLYDRAFAGESFIETDYFSTPVENWSEISYSPIHNGDKVIGVACHGRDITERKIAERKVVESENKYRSLVEQASDAIIVTEDEVVIETNTKCEKLFGYEKKELMRLTPLDFIPFEDRGSDPSRLIPIGTGEKIVFERKIKRKDGTILDVEISALKTQDGKLISIIRDITERKRNELRLTEKCHDLNTYIYKTSHDLRGPVVSTLGLINIIKSEFTDKGFLDYIIKLEQCNYKMLTILDSLGEVNKISGKQIKRTEIDFEITINDLISNLRNLPASDDIEFKVRVNLIESYSSDADLIGSILQNLIHNAIIYRRKRAGAFVQILVYERRRSLILEVNDNGLGIQPDQQSKIYDMFYRANVNSRGSGLGLYIVKSAIEKLDGTISLESEINKGSAFKVTLPLTKN
jgi:PAS domain S-box-containing protein